MQTTVTKWGNSLAIRIPKAFADQVGIDYDSKVKIVLDEDKIVVNKEKQNLDQLLAQVTPSNIHTETDTGNITGKEQW